MSVDKDKVTVQVAVLLLFGGAAGIFFLGHVPGAKWAGLSAILVGCYLITKARKRGGGGASNNLGRPKWFMWLGLALLLAQLTAFMLLIVGGSLGFHSAMLVNVCVILVGIFLLYLVFFFFVRMKV